MLAIRSTTLALIFAGLCLPAPPLTAIRDVLYRADGNRFDGVGQIEWKSFRAADGTDIPQNKVEFRIVRGVVSVDLVPTTNAQVPTYYTVRFNSEGRTQFVEYWSVPQHPAPLKIKDVRTHAISAGSLTGTPVTLAVQDVSGLRTELDLRPQRGANWLNGRVAVIGANGGIEAAIGEPGSCLRIDGTTTPCGFAGITFVDNEVPLGTLNGVNPVFTLSTAPLPESSLALYRNGMLLKKGTEYTISGAAVTFTSGHVPTGLDTIHASYRVNAESASAYVDMETPTGPVNGSNREFQLSQIPMPASSVFLYRNGLLQKQGFDYTISVNTITFVPGATPGPGDTLLASYRK